MDSNICHQDLGIGTIESMTGQMAELGLKTWDISRMVDKEDEYGPLGPLPSHFDMWDCGGPGLDGLGHSFYVELIPKGCDTHSMRDTAKTFWNHSGAGIRDEFLAFAESQHQWLPHRHGVYIAAEMSDPWSHRIQQMMSAGLEATKDDVGLRMREALFVAMYGDVRGQMCQHCEYRLSHFGSRYGHHQLRPFHACIAHPELAAGRCANCLFYDDDGCKVLHELPSIDRNNDEATLDAHTAPHQIQKPVVDNGLVCSSILRDL